MNNNRVLKKICIASGLKHFEVQEIFALGGTECSSSRIKSFMAGSGNKNFEALTDELLEQFLNGMIVYSRGSLDEPDMLPRAIENYILGLVEAGKTTLLEEIEALVADGRDALAESVS